MKIAILSGSPKGSASVTLRYAQFLQLHNSEHSFEIYHIGQQIARLEKNHDYFESVFKAIATADALLWVTPVYYLLVPAQLKHFIELLYERGKQNLLTDKPVAAITTSIHFFDNTALRYLKAVSEDLGLNWFGAYPAEMSDLRRYRERERLNKFGRLFLQFVDQNKIKQSANETESDYSSFIYKASPSKKTFTAAGHNISIIADLENPNSNLSGMISYFRSCFEEKISLVNLAEAGITLGCRGCLVCGVDNRCFYESRDNFKTIFETAVTKSDIIIIGGQIRDRFLSARWKTFMDRSFYMNHVPYLKNKQIGLIITGPLKKNSNLVDVMESYITMHQGNPAGFVTDEAASSETISRSLENLAKALTDYAEVGYTVPQHFPTTGGRKIFRDFIAGPAQVVFPADYGYYRKNYFFNYPQRHRIMQATVFLLRNVLKIPWLRQVFSRRIITGMVQPLDRIIDREKTAVSVRKNST